LVLYRARAEAEALRHLLAGMTLRDEAIRTSPCLIRNSMEYQNGQPLLGHAPAGAHGPQPKANFQTSGYSTHSTEAIIDACCDAWMRLVAEQDRIKSLCSYPWIMKVAS